MGVLLTISTLIIFYVGVIRLSNARREKVLLDDMRQTLLLFKLKTIRQYYDELNSMPYMEIVRRYDLEDAYNRIGRR